MVNDGKGIGNKNPDSGDGTSAQKVVNNEADLASGRLNSKGAQKVESAIPPKTVKGAPEEVIELDKPLLVMGRYIRRKFNKWFSNSGNNGTGSAPAYIVNKKDSAVNSQKENLSLLICQMNYN